jgi:uncharacterized membrane protein YobD (UPF0266 family)
MMKIEIIFLVFTYVLLIYVLEQQIILKSTNSRQLHQT